MTTSTVLQGPAGTDLWQIIPDPANGDLFSIQAKVSGAWVTMTTVDQSTGRMSVPALVINNRPGMPFQKGLSIGLGKMDGSDADHGNNYLKMFSDEPLEQYFQLNLGMVPNADWTKITAFQEAIVQGHSPVPFVTRYQHHVRTIDDATSSTTARDAYTVDGGVLGSGWERFIKLSGNAGAVVVGAISAYLNGLERRLRLWAGGVLVAECHEDGGMTIGNVPSKGAGTLNVARALYVNGVLK